MVNKNLSRVMDRFALFLETKELQAELLEVCGQQMTYFLHYCKKNSIPIPNEKEFLRLIRKTSFIIDQLEIQQKQSYQPSLNTDKKDTDNLPEPLLRCCYLHD